jgi:hypothetical protein
MATIDDLARQFVTIAAAERDKIEIRMFEGGLEYADIVENLDAIDELNGRVAAAIRNTVATVRHLPPDEQVAAIAEASRAAFDEFFK